MNKAFPTHPLPQTVKYLDAYRPTGLKELPGLARLADVGRVFVKLEAERPLGNFKFLGGMIAGLRALAHAGHTASVANPGLNPAQAVPLPRLICASDGNHGLSVAAAAQHAGALASIYLPENVSRARADRIKGFGGEIFRVRGTYDDAVAAAAAAAALGDGILLPDTTGDPNNAAVRDVMAGYGLLAEELVSQFSNDIKAQPSHMFVQAGVGGLAAAMAQGLGSFMRQPRRLLTVEPEQAACVAEALCAGRPVRIPGDLKTSAEMLSCGLASAPALEILLRYGARSIVVQENQLQAAVGLLAKAGGPVTTPSGAAGLAGLLHVAARPELRVLHGLESDSKVLLIVTEGAIAD